MTKRGTLQIDRRYPEIGRVRMASGTKDPRALDDIYAMLDAFARGVPPRYDLLTAIKERRITPLYALSLWRQGQVQLIPLADALPMLEQAGNEWLVRLTCSSEYKASIRSTLKALLALQDAPALGDLPRLVAKYRLNCVVSDHLVQFNRARSHVLALVRDLLRPSHAIYRQVQDVPTLPVIEKRVRRAQTPLNLVSLLQLLPTERRLEAWTMAATGMGQKEYWGNWTISCDRIHIAGTKRESRVRDVPRWTAVIMTALTRDEWEAIWTASIGDKLNVYDLRRSFAVWLEEAGIPVSRQWLYMGHKAPTQTGTYQSRELSAWLVGDARRLREYVESNLRGDVVPTPTVFAEASTDVLAGKL